ncbi:molecular chaperone DnaJ [Halobacteriales archaeon QS_8_69_26]|nr:MAG: molecular chaperone DnaJ [Halobacteriales archaeon QS_8_69_26]
MSRSPLLVGVGGVLSGVAVVMTLLAIAYEPFLFLVALPFGGAGYLIWYQGTGRLAARVRRRARRAEDAAGEANRRTAPGEGRRTATGDGRRRRTRARAAPGEGRRRTARGTGQRASGTADPRFGPGAGRGRAGNAEYGPGGYAPGAAQPSGPTTEEAYRRLDLEPGSDSEAIREAYREKVKEVHPDRGGSEEEFKEVTEAFETLDERVR